MARYSEHAAFIAQKPEAAILRRFQELHARIILLLHADLCNLEKDLNDIVQKAIRPDSNTTGSLVPEDLDFEWKTIRDSPTPLAQEHRAKIAEIQEKLFTYYENLIQSAKLRRFGVASAANLEVTRDWLLLQRPWNIDDMRPWLHEEVDPKELLTLSPKLDGFDSWLGQILKPFWHQMVDEQPMLPSLAGHDNTKAQDLILRCAPESLILVGNICTVLLSSAIFVCSVIALNFTEATHFRLIIIFVFTVIFSSVLMFVAHCRRSEVFAGTAGFCAVLIVFIHGVSPGECV
ncbi:uncharacterized protein A1O9_05073 [Exophiala aquamarina CBS 119918]|uniref:DUF6594 domain-containing protein n=1 Tax=Exophiala aquamarina CBS 119918 TaxID=1182545 RepID=A0A072PLL5_9EURO|nr:uncharacterized protein A1O9_05073 [Exophiala aquamarina CBS 119918]KEF60223.1 hypothetical protein A1O9_05073 [Exophiala aquamarina CBS 119918]